VRERVSRRIDRRTGAVETVTEMISDDAGFGQRSAELKASVPAGMGPVEAAFLAVSCNGCSATEQLDYDNPRLPDGWVSDEAGEFCPECVTASLFGPPSA
jgi:hypothetical protein